jgi:hypothetical protein
VLDPDLATSNTWRVTSRPATFLVKPGGEAAGMAIGAREWNGAEMRALIETLPPASWASSWPSLGRWSPVATSTVRLARGTPEFSRVRISGARKRPFGTGRVMSQIRMQAERR